MIRLLLPPKDAAYLRRRSDVRPLNTRRQLRQRVAGLLLSDGDPVSDRGTDVEAEDPLLQDGEGMSRLLLNSGDSAYLWWWRNIWPLNTCPEPRRRMVGLLLSGEQRLRLGRWN